MCAVVKYNFQFDTPALNTMHSWLGVMAIVVFCTNYSIGEYWICFYMSSIIVLFYIRKTFLKYFSLYCCKCLWKQMQKSCQKLRSDSWICFKFGILGAFMATLKIFHPTSTFRTAFNLVAIHRVLGLTSLGLTTAAVLSGIMDRMPQGTRLFYVCQNECFHTHSSPLLCMFKVLYCVQLER